jgi:hypothetical protein
MAQSVQQLGGGLNGRGVGDGFPAKIRGFSLHGVQITSGAHPASRTVGAGGYFPLGKVAGT